MAYVIVYTTLDGRYSTDSLAFNTAGANLIAGFDGTYSYNMFMRFAGVAVPPNAIIQSAELLLYAKNSPNGDVSFRISAFDDDNGAAPTSASAANAQTQTTAQVDWNMNGTWISGTPMHSPDFAAVIQEIVNRAGWSSGNAIVMHVRDNSSGNDIVAASLEDTVYQEARLTIFFAEGDTEPPTTPTNVQASAPDAGTVNLSWTASTDNVAVTGYRIRRGGTVIGTSGTPSYSDTTVEPSTLYSYTVSAYDAANNESTQSSPATQITTPATGTETTPPTVPANLTATIQPGPTVKLEWDPSTDVSGVVKYKVYRDTTFLADVAHVEGETQGGGGGGGGQTYPLAAFPGAVGFGTQTRGAFSGSATPNILYVTNTNNAGAGSLRAALEATGPRVIIVKVGGTISLTDDIDVVNPYFTLTGGLAPGDGVQVKGCMILIHTHDWIIRYMRLRPGDAIIQGASVPSDRDAVTLHGQDDEIYNGVFDHCTLIWGPDIGGPACLNNCHDLTFSYCILGEGLYFSNHGEAQPDGHALGFNITRLQSGPDWGRRITLHHNLLINSDARMPQIMEAENIDIINNVIYNPGKKAAHGNPRSLNLINNRFKGGPNTDATCYAWFPDTNTLAPNLFQNSVYESGNVQTGLAGLRDSPTTPYRTTQVTPISLTTIQTAAQAYDEVLANAGCRLPVLDSVDTRLINQVINDTGQFLNGVDDPAPKIVWPTLASGTPYADANNNGLSDTFESTYPTATAPYQDINGDGWTNLEHFLWGTDPAGGTEPTEPTNGDPVPSPGDKFVSPTGATAGPGSEAQPWSLGYALGGAGGSVTPGTKIWLRGGTYSGNWTLSLDGTAANPISFLAYPGETVTIRSNTSQGMTFFMDGCSYLDFYNLIFSWPTWTRGNRDDAAGTLYEGCAVQASNGTNTQTRIRWYNCAFKNVAGMGVRSWQTDVGCEWHGCNFYYNGFNKFEHGIYCRNDVGTEKILRNCFFHHNSGHNIHGYGTYDEADFNIQYCAFWQAGGLYDAVNGGNAETDIRLERTAGPTDSNYIRYNWQFSNMGTDDNSQGLVLKGGIGWTNHTVQNNTFVGNYIDLSDTPRTGNSVTNNNFFGCSYRGDTEAFIDGQVGNVTVVAPTTGTEIHVRRFDYNHQRGSLVIYNWANANTVTVSHAQLVTGGGLDLAADDQYELINMENPLNDRVTGTYNGTSIIVPMTGHTMETPIGTATPTTRTGFPKFGAFQIVITKGVIAPVPVTQTYTDTTVTPGIHTYTVSAVDVFGNESAQSTGAQVDVAAETALNLSVTEDGRYCLADGTFDTNNVNLVFGLDATSRHMSVFTRFFGLGVPQGATIDEAWITFRSVSNMTGAAHLRISAERNANASIPTGTTDIAARPRTVAQVAWNVTTWATGNNYTTPELKTIIQEIVSQPAWVFGNPILLLIEDDNTSTDGMRAAASEHLTETEPVLHVAFTIGTNTPPTPPTGLTAVPTSGQNVRLTWNPSTDDSGIIQTYKIYRNGVYLISSADLIEDIGGLTPNTAYTFYVTAVDGTGVEGSQSNTINITTLANYEVLNSAHDGRWRAADSTFTATTTSLAAGNVDRALPNSHAFMRFNNILIPQNAVILGAFLTLRVTTASRTAADQVNLRIRAVKQANPSAPNSAADAESRPRTTTQVLWTVDDSWVVGNDVNPPSVYGIVQELVQQSTWASGNAMVFLIEDNNAQEAIFWAAYDDAVAPAPRLTIQYMISDNTDPTIPTNVTAVALSPTSVRVNWNLSTDDVGVDHYRIYRDGLFQAEAVAPPWIQTGLTPATAYVYTVVAADTSGNTSTFSAPANVSTPATGANYTPSGQMSQVFIGVGSSSLSFETCYIVSSEPFALAPLYFVQLRDWTGNVIAVFTDWISFNCHDELNGVGNFTIKLDGNDPRCDKFNLDYIVELYRAVPGVGIDWYPQFTGLVRSTGWELQENGQITFTVRGLTPNHLLSRTAIMYQYATTKSYKEGKRDVVIAEYVRENCTEEATVENEREVDGVILGFQMGDKLKEHQIGLAQVGLSQEDYSGEHAFANLFETVRDIAIEGHLVFNVYYSPPQNFIFVLHSNYLGSDHSLKGYTGFSGKNGSGNYPVVFAIENGNVKTLEYIDDHTSEGNVVAVIGPGDGATRPIEIVTNNAALIQSPFNRCEISRPSQEEFQWDRRMYGREALNEAAPRRFILVKPLQTETCMFGKHYRHGDMVSAKFRNFSDDILVYAYDLTLEAGRENLEITLDHLKE